MRRSLFALVLVCLFICPHSSFAQTAEELNERITGATDTLALLAVMWKHAFRDATDAGKGYKSLAPFRKYLAQYAGKQVELYKKPSGVEGADSLCAAVVALFEFEKSYVANNFTPFEGLGARASESEIRRYDDKLIQEGIPERALLSKLSRERKEFGAKNGIDVELKPAAPKPAYQRPLQLYRKKGDSGRDHPAPKESDPAPAPPTQPRAPVAQKPAPAERPTSSGNPNAKKAPPTEEDGKKDKDKEEGEEDEKD